MLEPIRTADLRFDPSYSAVAHSPIEIEVNCVSHCNVFS